MRKSWPDEEYVREEIARRRRTMPAPQYHPGDVVEFRFGPVYSSVDPDKIVLPEENKEGIIEIVDAFGTFEQNEEPSYDIYIRNENTLYKHVRESDVIRKLRTSKPGERL